MYNPVRINHKGDERINTLDKKDYLSELNARFLQARADAMQHKNATEIAFYTGRMDALFSAAREFSLFAKMQDYNKTFDWRLSTI